MLIKKNNTSILKRNNRQQTFCICERCSIEFGPIDRLDRRFCSVKCARSSGRNKRTITYSHVRSAQRRISYLVQIGQIKKPKRCENCDKLENIEAAHYDYNKPLKIRWLCVSCHRKWDKKNKKNGTYSISV